MNLSNIISFLLTYKYFALFITTIVEGPIAMMTSGVLVRLGIVSLIPVYLLLILADLTGDTFWYCIGYYFAHPISEKYGKYIGLSAEVLQALKEKFHSHQRKILFTSKVTLGLGFPLAPLVVAGMTRMPFKKYISTLFFGQFIWTGGLLAVGYFFGGAISKIDQNLKILFSLAFMVVVGFIVYGIGRYLKNKNFYKK